MEGIGKSPEIHLMDYYTALKRDEHTTRLDVGETPALKFSKRNQTQKNVSTYEKFKL